MQIDINNISKMFLNIKLFQLWMFIIVKNSEYKKVPIVKICYFKVISNISSKYEKNII